jgi:hypothetical protein
VLCKSSVEVRSSCFYFQMLGSSSSHRRPSMRHSTAPVVEKKKARDVALAIFMKASNDVNLNVAQACRDLNFNPKSYDYYRKQFQNEIDPLSIDGNAVIAAVYPAAAQAAAAPVDFPYLSGKAPATPVDELRAFTLMKGKKNQGYLGKKVTKAEYNAVAVWGNNELQAHL